MKKKGRFTKKKAVILLVIVILAVPAGFFAYKKSSRISYYAQQLSVWLKPKKLPKKSTESFDKAVTLSELLADERVTVNQSMMLINTQYTLADDFEADISEYKTSKVIMNNCLMDSYAKLAEEVNKRFSQKLYVRSAYRSEEEQKEQIEENGAVATAVGASEHQAGLGLDVYVPFFAGSGFINCPAGKWVNEECKDYGFIIRYPYYGKGETGIGYEPWHLRYVGLPHSELIMDNHMTLESYVELFEPDLFYRYDSYVFSRQSGDSLVIPQDFVSCTISPDNTGYYFMTFLMKE